MLIISRESAFRMLGQCRRQGQSYRLHIDQGLASGLKAPLASWSGLQDP